jgi:hypothetical protein
MATAMAITSIGIACYVLIDHVEINRTIRRVVMRSVNGLHEKLIPTRRQILDAHF